MRMLNSDRLRFEAEHPSAVEFVRAATLRYEAFVLARKPYSLLTPWEVDRLKSLLTEAPACQENWFVAMVQHDGNTYAKELVS